MSPLHLTSAQWLLALLSALLIGVSKTGIMGIGIFAVALFALVIPAKQSVGVVVPLLITGDIVAVLAYRRHAVWAHLWRLFPWAAAGVVSGYFAIQHIHDDQDFKHILGGILLLMVVLQMWRRRTAGNADDEPPHPGWYTALTGMAAGFTTMLGNAAGPIMTLYLLSMRLPKLEYVGTGAWYFLLLNCFKVPFNWRLHMIDQPSLLLDLKLVPAVLAGALCGRIMLKHINQLLFENLALLFTALAAVRLWL